MVLLWRRRRDLNPRDTFAPYSLSRGAPSPLGYFSKGCCLYKKMWRRGWDSNPRALSDKRFSRPPRYDHFDTSPTIYLSAASVSPQRQDVFYHSFSLSSILFFNFFIFLYFSYFPVFFVYKYSSLQRLIHGLRSAFYMLNKSFCRIQIFRCRNLNIRVRTFI